MMKERIVYEHEAACKSVPSTGFSVVLTVVAEDKVANARSPADDFS
jgi:hypothetical protein